MKLSILICSHEKRRPLLERLVSQLKEQTTNDVEVRVITNTDPNKRGIDRNKLLDECNGEYCAFVDDDDVVSPSYVSSILKAIESRPEICSITGMVTSLVNHDSYKFVLSTGYNEIFSLASDNIVNDTYYRFASHLNPIRTDIARKVRFPENLFHEDNGYSDRLKEFKHAWNEVTIPNVIYYYFSRIIITNKRA